MDMKIARHLGCAYLLSVLLGCAHHAPRVDCEGALQPINSPEPALTDPTPSSDPPNNGVVHSPTGASVEEDGHGR